MRTLALLSVLVLSAASWASEPEIAPDQVEHVQDFVAAFNQHDVDAMASYVTDDVQWLSVNGASIAVETQGKTALVQAMTDYFKSCASCQSELVNVMVSGSRVTTVEQASWVPQGQLDSARKSQESIAVYEFEGGLIARVYYFPAG